MIIENKDLYRYFGNATLRNYIYALIRIPGFRYMWLWRRAKRSNKYNPLGWIFKLLYFHFSYKYGFQIPLYTQIGEGFYIGHFGTIIINRYAKIGKNCNISPNVTLGGIFKGDKTGAPIIGESVWIGTGAIIVGGITIGNNVLIAPNSFVNFDVPSNSLVIGNPGEIKIKDSSIVDGYINFPI